MREPDNIAALSALQPDYMGFIFWAPSSRYVSETTPVLDKRIKKTDSRLCCNRKKAN